MVIDAVLTVTNCRGKSVVLLGAFPVPAQSAVTLSTQQEFLDVDPCVG